MLNINKAQFRRWTKVDLSGGGWIRVRPEGQEFVDALNSKVADARSTLGLPPDTDTPPLPHVKFMEVFLEAHIGTTFGGFGNINDESGTPLPGGDDPNNLDVAVCKELLAIDEIWDEFVTAKNRLVRSRSARWEGTEKNLLPPSPGSVGGAVN